MKIRIKKLKAETIIPSYAHHGDAGLDLHSLEDYNLQPGESHFFKLGFALELPEGYVALNKDKGGLAIKHGLHNLGGVYDHGFRGEYNAMLINLSEKAYQIKKGDKISQLVVLPFANVELEEAEEINNNTSRKDGNFGSTGR